MTYEKELKIAQLAIQRASIVSKNILKDYHNLYSKKTITKQDHSPVTIADYAVQAVVIQSITENFPNDKFVAEETSQDLIDRQDLQELIVKYIEKSDSEFFTNFGNVNESYKLRKMKGKQEIIENLSKGGFSGNSDNQDQRFWVLDPIDGTKGFLRNQQFSLCLALIDKKKIRVGVNGCPNLPKNIKQTIENHDFSKNGNFKLDEKYTNTEAGNLGLLFFASENTGSFVHDLYSGVTAESSQKIYMDKLKMRKSIEDCIVVEGVEIGHSDHKTQLRIKEMLNIPNSRTINLDSQVKYCLLAYGVSDVYLRLPIDMNYREKIWDHSSGYLLVKESGGVTTDMNGIALDFNQGRYLPSSGIIAGSEPFHSEIIDAIKKIKKEE